MHQLWNDEVFEQAAYEDQLRRKVLGFEPRESEEMIDIIKKSDIVANVPKRWLAQYKDYKDRGDRFDKAPTTAALLALPHGFSAREVEDIIGNTSWTENNCDECGLDRVYLIRIGDRPDYDARWVDICEDCLLESVDKLKACYEAS